MTTSGNKSLKPNATPTNSGSEQKMGSWEYPITKMNLCTSQKQQTNSNVAGQRCSSDGKQDTDDDDAAADEEWKTFASLLALFVQFAFLFPLFFPLEFSCFCHCES